MNTHPHFLFVYGTLKRGNGNNGLLVRNDSIFVAQARTVEKFLLNDGFPFVFPADDRGDARAAMNNVRLGHVIGDLYRVNDVGLQMCDALEGHPTSYTRTPIKVQYGADDDRHVVEAGIYLILRKNYVWQDLQAPDGSGTVEWGRHDRKFERNLQRDSGKRHLKG